MIVGDDNANLLVPFHGFNDSATATKEWVSSLMRPQERTKENAVELRNWLFASTRASNLSKLTHGLQRAKRRAYT
jgi:hypothetical protein